MVATAALGIVVLGVGIALADGQQGWNIMYNHIYSDMASHAETARIAFDSLVRKASRNYVFLDETSTWLEVWYYEGLDSTFLDRYARFYRFGSQLRVEYGGIDTDGNKYEFSAQTLCSDVSGCFFISAEGSVEMILKLDNGCETATVVSSAIAQN